MDKLILKNVGTEYAYINDLGVGVAPGEDLDLIPNYRDEDVLESTDLQSVIDNEILEVWLNNTVRMSYTNIIDYLTKLTRYDVIDFNYVSSEDVNTDITSLELEELTDGSDTSLHNHDNRYYTEIELSTSGQSSIHWDNITNKPTADNLTELNGQLYIYDSNRDKTLSVHEQNFVFSSKAASGRFLDYGSGFGFDVGGVCPYNATITRFSISSSDGFNNKTIEIRKNNTSILSSYTLVNSIEVFNIDIDVNINDLLQIFITSGGPAIKDIVATLFIREKI